MLVYDITAVKSFENIKKWLGNVKEVTVPSVCLFVCLSVCLFVHLSVCKLILSVGPFV